MKNKKTEMEEDTKEADIVSVRIVKLLGEKTFQFSSVERQNIHRILFEGVLRHAGKIRKRRIRTDVKVICSNRKTFAIQVNFDLSVTVRVPKRASAKDIDRILREKHAALD